MGKILNYIKINELISTSGQPQAHEFKELKNEGFEVIINLCTNEPSEIYENEDKIVTDLNMSYFHIPVSFENPRVSDLKLFLNLLQCLGSNKILIHCSKNYRVSAFIYVFHKYILNTPFEEIDLSIFEEWMPEKHWQELMKVELEELYKA